MESAGLGAAAFLPEEQGTCPRVYRSQDGARSGLQPDLGVEDMMMGEEAVSLVAQGHSPLLWDCFHTGVGIPLAGGLTGAAGARS